MIFGKKNPTATEPYLTRALKAIDAEKFTEAQQLIQDYVHDSSVYLVPHYALPKELPGIINEYREAAVEAMKEAGTAHAVYGVKKYDQGTGALSRVDLYVPAVLLDDAEFYRRTDAEAKENPGCIILASHAKK